MTTSTSSAANTTLKGRANFGSRSRISGETFVSGGRGHARLLVAETEGYAHPDVDVTPEVVAEHWAQTMDESDHYVPTDTGTWLKGNADRIAAIPITSPA